MICKDTLSDKKKISIVIACRNERKHIRAFTESLLAQDLGEFNWELIIADGNSDDGTREFLSEFARWNPHITLIDNSFRIVATGLNSAIRAASGDVILRMDTHTEYAPDYVKKCVKSLETSDACNVGGPARTKAEGLCSRAIQAAYHSRFSCGGARFHDEHYSGYVDTVPYGCWRKETLMRIGLFDEELVRNQDDELNLRLIRAGGKIWQSADIVSWYHPRSTLSSLFRQYFQYGFWKVLVIRKHRLPASWRHLIPGTFMLLNSMLILAVIVAATDGARFALKTATTVWATLLISYALACLVFAVFSARRHGWRLLPYLPPTFAVFHTSYGLGFLAGLIYWPFARAGRLQLGNLFEGDTR
jgi:glycosyltransferase involved in cell wall biosynthesis